MYNEFLFFYKKIKDITLILHNQAILFDFSHFFMKEKMVIFFISARVHWEKLLKKL